MMFSSTRQPRILEVDDAITAKWDLNAAAASRYGLHYRAAQRRHRGSLYGSRGNEPRFEVVPCPDPPEDLLVVGVAAYLGPDCKAAVGHTAEGLPIRLGAGAFPLPIP